MSEPWIIPWQVEGWVVLLLVAPTLATATQAEIYKLKLGKNRFTEQMSLSFTDYEMS